MDRFQKMPTSAADSRPRRFGNTISTSRRYAPGLGRANSYNIQNSDQQNQSKNLISSPFPPLKSAVVPGQRPGTPPLYTECCNYKYHCRCQPLRLCRAMAHYVNHHPRKRVFFIPSSTTKSEPTPKARGPTI